MEAGLIVEVDGSQHGELESRIKDQKRDQFLRSEGYEIVRLWIGIYCNTWMVAFSIWVKKLRSKSRQTKGRVISDPSP
jgi:very-short-patch-repair endonuclease